MSRFGHKMFKNRRKTSNRKWKGGQFKTWNGTSGSLLRWEKSRFGQKIFKNRGKTSHTRIFVESRGTHTILFSLANGRTNRPACPVSAISNLSLTPPPSPINQSSWRRWQRVKERLQQIRLGDIFSIRPCLPLTMMSSLPKECPGLTGQLLPGPLYDYPWYFA